MKYFKNIFLLIFLLYSFIIKAQITGVNFVNNPSFEQYDSCPNASNEMNYCKQWWGFSCEYYNTCDTLLFYVSVPKNQTGYQYAHSGDAYAGYAIYAKLLLTNPDYRESIKTKLIDTLNINKRYCTEFYISLAESSITSQFSYYVLLDSIGMLFTKYQVPDFITPVLSSGIRVQNNIFNLDTINWLKINNSFIANGGEKYLTIGNFDNVINWAPSKTGDTYVYVDDVSVCECSFNFNLGNDTNLCIGQSLILKPNMPNAKYTWQDGSHGSTYTVTHAGTYWVSAYFADYNITTYDTINISYYPTPIVNLGNDTTLCKGQSVILNDTNQNYIYLWQDGSTIQTYNVTQQGFYWIKVTDSNNCIARDTINILYKNCDTTENIIFIYPNPATDNLTIETNFNEEHRLEIINILGQTIYTTYIGRKSIINTSNYASGLYFLKIYTDKEIVVKKFVKE